MNESRGLTALVICSGERPATERLRDEFRRADLALATDGVAAWLEQQGFAVDAVVGDLDSLGPGVLRAPLVDAGPHEVQSNSDSEKALLLALERGATTVRLLGATGGGRLDHTLGNVALCAAYWHRARVQLATDDQILEVTGAAWEARLKPGTPVSLVPLTPDAAVTTSGLEWELDEPLEYGTRGLSNRARGGTVVVRVQRGLVSVIWSTDRAAAEVAP